MPVIVYNVETELRKMAKGQKLKTHRRCVADFALTLLREYGRAEKARKTRIRRAVRRGNLIQFPRPVGV